MLVKGTMREKNRNRSDFYQSVLLELSVSPFILGDLSSAQGLSYKLQPFDTSDKLLDLKDKLK